MMDLSLGKMGGRRSRKVRNRGLSVVEKIMRSVEGIKVNPEARQHPEIEEAIKNIDFELADLDQFIQTLSLELLDHDPHQP